jgi:methionyl-tRNA formyltransferase
MLDTLAIKLWKVSFVKEEHLFTPGYIIIDNNDYFKIACLNGFIYVYELQMSGKKRTTFKVYKNGHKLELYEGVVLNETK